MPFLPGRLGTLVASHVMTTDLVSLNSADTISVALHKLQDRHVGGAPVVNAEGELVGILSISDLMDFDAPDSRLHSSRMSNFPDWPSLWKMIDETDKGICIDLNETVEQHMTHEVKSAPENTTLIEMARLMCDGHWHHLPIVDSRGKLTGIVTTMDIMAAIVNAADEHTHNHQGTRSSISSPR
ncbi:MAG: hypothetical protein CMJ46_15255 [Planctomyces sp.]|nr:hypothetical protein [Planctomyces sp.]